MTDDDGAETPTNERVPAFDAGRTVFPGGEARDGTAGEGSDPADAPQPIEVLAHGASCQRTDHDPAMPGVRSWGGWLGDEYTADRHADAWEKAIYDLNGHIGLTQHVEAVVSTRTLVFFPVEPWPPEEPLGPLDP